MCGEVRGRVLTSLHGTLDVLKTHVTRITPDPDGTLRTCQFDREAGAAVGGRSHLNGVPWLLAKVGATADSVARVAQQHGWCRADDGACPSRREGGPAAGLLLRVQPQGRVGRRAATGPDLTPDETLHQSSGSRRAWTGDRQSGQRRGDRHRGVLMAQGEALPDGSQPRGRSTTQR